MESGGGNKSLACFIVGCRCVLLLLQGVPGQVYPLRLLTTNISCKTHTHTHILTKKSHKRGRKEVIHVWNNIMTICGTFLGEHPFKSLTRYLPAYNNLIKYIYFFVLLLMCGLVVTYVLSNYNFCFHNKKSSHTKLETFNPARPMIPEEEHTHTK